MAEKVTIMVLKVDLQCPCCYKKVKKILCKFPQIRDQVYNEKENKVRITVVCCDPEKIRDKLCCKGRKVIKSIEIVEPPKPKEKPPPPPQEKPKEKPPPPPQEKPKEKPPPPPPQEKPKEKPPPPPPQEKPKEKPPPPPPCGYPPVVPVRTCCGPCSEGYGGGPCYFGHGVPPPPLQEKPKEKPPPPPPAEPIMGPGPCGYPPVVPVRTCCGPCSEGYGGGPCYLGYGVPPPPQPQPCYDGYYGYGNRDRPCHVTRCDYYFSEENPQACSIM